jgi:4-hydroxybenzoate polyprenyltransferase
VADLDGTLIETDLLYEAFILLIKKNAFHIFNCIIWIYKGKAYLKARIFELVDIQYQWLPYNKNVIDFLNAEFNNGRKIILATASPLSAAEEIAKVHPFISEVYGSSEELNLKGKNKANLLSSKIGEKQFDYIGNASEDLEIFKVCRNAYLVNASGKLKKQTAQVAILKKSWETNKKSIKDYIKAVRAYQWIKNLLLFVPLITSHSYGSIKLFTLSFLGFGIFSMVASAGYLFNDLLDLDADRRHPRKRNRPMASGRLSVLTGLVLASFLLIAGLFFASTLDWHFFTIVMCYFITSFVYSFLLKKIVLYDVFLLALLYSIRVFAGAIVIDVILSFWLIAFSTFIFLSLAFVKRYSELIQLNETDGQTSLKERGRGYVLQDSGLLLIMGVTSGFLAIVVFSLYINSTEITQLYTQPKILWPISFLFLFWISRIWLISTRGKMTDDPIVFAVKDSTSYVVFIITGILILLASM